MAEKRCLKDGIFNNLEVGGLLLGKNVELTSKTSQEPVLTLENTTNDANGAILKFVKDKGAAGAADDVNGLIQFFGDDANQDQVTFSEVKSQVKVHTNGQEGGKFTVSVAEHDGTLATQPEPLQDHTRCAQRWVPRGYAKRTTRPKHGGGKASWRCSSVIHHHDASSWWIMVLNHHDALS